MSQEFDTREPHVLLEDLYKIADVKIVKDQNLHAKLYLFNYINYSQIVSGSANLTRGGCEENIEILMTEK